MKTVFLQFLSRTTLLFVLTVLFPSHAESRPNIIIILSDDVGYSDIGCYGGEVRTPNLDRLALEGRQFTQFYNAARCCPSRASLLTGLYPHQAGIGHLIYPTIHPGYSDRLADDSVTIAEVLQSAGYATFMSGKWHLAPRSYHPTKDVQHWPTRRGFERFYGTIAGSGSFWDPSTLCRDESFITPENDPLYQPDLFYYTDAITDNALMFLQDKESSEDKRPFFLYLSYTAAHWPLHVPDEEMRAYEGQYDSGYAAIHAQRVERMREMGLIPEVSSVAPVVGDWADVDNKPVEAALMEAYAGMITRMDKGIGQVMDYLEKSGLREDTLVFYLQDNGACSEDWFSTATKRTQPYEPMGEDTLQTSYRPTKTRDGRPVRRGADVIPGPDDTYTAYKENWANVSNAPFRKYKHYVHEGGISTPLIINWPATLKSTNEDRFIREPAHLIDIMATCLDAAKAQYPGERDGVALQPMVGVSLFDFLKGRAETAHERYLFWEHEGNRAVRKGKWKLVAVDGEPWELYDMESDRGETQNLVSVYPRISATMAGEWFAWAQQSRVLPLGGWLDLDDGRQTISLRQGDQLAPEECPLLTGQQVSLAVKVLEGPLQGDLISHGDTDNGYALTIHNDKVSLLRADSGSISSMGLEQLPAPPFTVRARIAANGRARLSIDHRRTDGALGDPFSQEPQTGLSVGGNYETTRSWLPTGSDKPFQGRLGFVTVRGSFPSLGTDENNP